MHSRATFSAPKPPMGSHLLIPAACGASSLPALSWPWEWSLIAVALTSHLCSTGKPWCYYDRIPLEALSLNSLLLLIHHLCLGLPQRYCGFSSRPRQSSKHCSKVSHTFFAGEGSCLQVVKNATTLKHDKVKCDKNRCALTSWQFSPSALALLFHPQDRSQKDHFETQVWSWLLLLKALHWRTAVLKTNIKILNIFIQWNITRSWKRMRSCQLWQHEWT